MTAPLFAFDKIEKAFFGVKVLKGITFEVAPGAVVGLVGENGAGKSTLMNIVGGNVSPDSGTMRFAGIEYQPTTPRDAQRHGIAFIHQELNLFPNLSIAENLFLTRFDRISSTPLIDRKSLNERARELLLQVGLKRSPDCFVENLSNGERQLVEIAKALSIDARLVIFDEPTTSLSAKEAETLFDLIHRLRSRGISIIYISHTLNHVLELCDPIVVLRDGAVVARGPSADFSLASLVANMVGREITQLYPTRGAGAPLGKVALRVKHLSQGSKLENISLSLHRGEILGLAGLMGAGRSELARCLFGLDPISEGEIEIFDGEVREIRPRRAIQNGLGFLTENRSLEGLCLDSSVIENMAMVFLPRHTQAPFSRLNLPSIQRAVDSIRKKVNVDHKVRNSQPVRTLSGGNQQKVVLGKWLLNDPKILILDEPTRGIDVGAKFEIYEMINRLAHEGAALLIISSEIEELIGLCDRILTMRRGRITGEFSRDNFQREAILGAALGPNEA